MYCESHELSTAEEDGHNKGVRKANFHAIDETVPGTLQYSQIVMIRGIRQDGFQTRHVGGKRDECRRRRLSSTLGTTLADQEMTVLRSRLNRRSL